MKDGKLWQSITIFGYVTLQDSYTKVGNVFD